MDEDIKLYFVGPLIGGVLCLFYNIMVLSMSAYEPVGWTIIILASIVTGYAIVALSNLVTSIITTWWENK